MSHYTNLLALSEERHNKHTEWEREEGVKWVEDFRGR